MGSSKFQGIIYDAFSIIYYMILQYNIVSTAIFSYSRVRKDADGPSGAPMPRLVTRNSTLDDICGDCTESLSGRVVTKQGDRRWLP